MSAFVLEVRERKSLVFGLQWREVMNLKTEVPTHAAELKASHFVKVSKNDESTISCGFLRSEDKAGLKGKAYSAAAALSNIEDLPEAVLFVYYYEPTDKHFLIGIKSGSPLPGFDKVVDSGDEVKTFAADFSVAAKTKVRIIGSSTILTVDTQLPLDALLEAAESSKSNLLAPYSKQDPVKIASALLAVGFLSFASWYGYDTYQKQLQREALQRAPQQQLDPNEAYAANLEQLKTQTGIPFTAVVPALQKAMANLPKELAGYKTSTVECSTSSCLVTWTVDSGTMKEFNQEVPTSFESINYDLSGSQVTNTISIATEAGNVVLTDLPKMRDFLIDQGSLFQKLTNLGFSFTIGAAEAFGVPPEIDSTQIQNIIDAGTITFSGPFWTIDGLNNLPPNVSLETLTLSVGEDSVTFNAQGKYYVQN